MLAAATLSVYKPRGMTRYGQRKQQEERRNKEMAGGLVFSDIHCVPCRERPYVTPIAILITVNIMVNVPHSTSTQPMVRS